MYQHSVSSLTASVLPTVGHNRGCTTKPIFLWSVAYCSVVETYRLFWKICYVTIYSEVETAGSCTTLANIY